VKVGPKKRDIVPRTKAQLDYISSIRHKDIVFGIGPAGTGKTYLAMAMAVSELLKGNYNRIILTRPAKEAGENLGFLPGNLEEKIMPYLRPLYDALYDMLDFEEASALIERNIIEVAPLAFMRGRTLNNAFIILDEAQNTTEEQMLMFLTRLGFDSQCVITGDPSQTDLAKNEKSGLMHSAATLKNIQEIGFNFFSTKDVVRHALVEKIINAYQQEG
jgi:phosphate starvation-inducible PhoH-like protein